MSVTGGASKYLSIGFLGFKVLPPCGSEIVMEPREGDGPEQTSLVTLRLGCYGSPFFLRVPFDLV